MKGFPPPADKHVTKDKAIQAAKYIRWSNQHMHMYSPSADVPATGRPYPPSRTIDWNFEKGIKFNEPGTDATKTMADYLKESDTVTNYVPGLKINDGVFAEATLGQVLNMTNFNDLT